MVNLFINRTAVHLLCFSLGWLIVTGQTFGAQATPEITWLAGPQVITVGKGLATLKIPAGYLYADPESTKAIMGYVGNPAHKNDLGLMMSANEADTWMVIYRYEPIGYVPDRTAQTLDPIATLRKIEAATVADNRARQRQGNAPLTVTGWDTPPDYNPQTHQLTWGITAQDEAGAIVNYSIRKLGRRGVTAINLVADPTDLPEVQPLLTQLVENYEYAEGARYEDFVPGQDRVATVEMAHLITRPQPLTSVNLMAQAQNLAQILSLAGWQGLVRTGPWLVIMALVGSSLSWAWVTKRGRPRWGLALKQLARYLETRCQKSPHPD